jgi:hypothetical protein
MNLSDEQKAIVRSWIESGAKLADIQNRLGKEFGAHFTYMEVRFLVDDLKVIPKDPEPPKTVTPLAPAKPDTAMESQPPELGEAQDELEELPPAAPTAGGKVTLAMDKVTLPGAMASGQVTFSDGQVAQWYLDQYGRLGLAPKQKGYRPPPGDLQAFQMELEKAFQKLGY